MNESTYVDFGSLQFEIVDKPYLTLNPEYRASLTEECVPLARQAFKNEGVTTSDIITHAIRVPTAVFVRSNTGELVAFASSLVETVLNRSIVYLEGTAILPAFQKRGLYSPLVALRILLGGKDLPEAAALVSTRTQSPLVMRTMVRKLGLYPRPGEPTPEDIKDVAVAFAAIVREKYSDFKSPDGLNFDRDRFIFRKAYEFCMYGTDIPWCGAKDEEVDVFVRQYLDLPNGDTVLLIGPFDQRRAKQLFMESATNAGIDGSPLLDALGL
jgi:hypothetical protein